MTSRGLAVVAFGIALLISTVSFAVESALVVTPTHVELDGKFARAQLLVKHQAGVEDLTIAAVYESSDSKVVSVIKSGQLAAVGDGQAVVRVTVGDSSAEVSVTVKNVSPTAKVDYITDVLPVLSKSGCNMGACHASQHGKGGFILSVFGFAPEKDHINITRDRIGRRTNHLEPHNSLLLLKPTMHTPHGGGLRLKRGGAE